MRRRRRVGRATAGERFRVLYLGAGARRAYVDGDWSRDAAISHLAALKRRGLTAWVEDDAGRFVPVRGAMRKPTERT